MVYRTGGLLDGILHGVDISGPNGGQIAAKGIEEYALECSMNKVFATEAVAYVVDEGVQIHGGYGYISEYPIERLYRDARIYRIFEGTNEINRILIPTTILRRVAKGDLDLKQAVEKLKEQLNTGVISRAGAGDLVQAAKDLFIYTFSAGLDKYGDKLLKQQEILGRLADLAMGVFAMESVWLRAQKALTKDGETGTKLKNSMTEAFIYSHIGKLELIAKDTIAALAEGEVLQALESDLRKLAVYTPKNVIALRQEIAAAVSEASKYVV
jgi:alkylation response protein AidB-like acyl-CoA dehydrogenase